MVDSFRESEVGLAPPDLIHTPTGMNPFLLAPSMSFDFIPTIHKNADGRFPLDCLSTFILIGR